MVEKKLNNKKSVKKVNKTVKKENNVENEKDIDSIKQEEKKVIKERKKNNNFYTKAMSFFHF